MGTGQNTPSLTSHVMNDHIRRLSTILRQIKKSYSKKEKTSNSHPLPYSNKGQEKHWKNYKTSRLEPIGNQPFSQTLMANDGNLFNSFLIQTTELISQSLQPSQNPAKDPRGTPEHSTSKCLRSFRGRI